MQKVQYVIKVSYFQSSKTDRISVQISMVAEKAMRIFSQDDTSVYCKAYVHVSCIAAVQTLASSSTLCWQTSGIPPNTHQQ